MATVPAAPATRSRPYLPRLDPAASLLAVCVAHGLLPLLVEGPRLFLGIDETVYASQYNGSVPAGVFSAPRSRGVPYLVAPITSWTTSIPALRIYLAVLSAAALYLGMRPWLRLRPGWTAPLAAALFSSLWVATYYGFEAMPNEWAACAAAAAVGLLLLFREQRSRSTLLWLAVALAAMGLFRPQDSAWLGIAMLGCALLLPRLARGDRLRLAGATVLGLAAGWAQWVVEAYTSYGGLFARIHAGQAENGGGGVHFALAAQARALGGPLLCRFGCQAHSPIVTRLWWVGALMLLAVAALASRPRGDLAVVVVPTVCAAAIVVEYTVSVTYAAPRFLLPAYALLALPCAHGVLWLVDRPQRRPVSAALLVLFALHLAVQLAVIRLTVLPNTHAQYRVAHTTAVALRRAGVRTPCSIRGRNNEIVAYLLHCGNAPVGQAAVEAEIRSGVRVVWISPRPPAPGAYWAGWSTIRVPRKAGVGYASLSPPP